MPSSSRIRRIFSAVRISRRKCPSVESFVDGCIDLPEEVTVPRHPLPVLPPEIWLLILRFAISYSTDYNPINFPADTDACDEPISFITFPHSHSHLELRLRYYYASMQEKLALTMVCKHWYKIAQELLYEFIWLNRASQATALATTLLRQRDPRIPVELRSTHKGHLIKRMHIETPTMERCSPSDLRIIIDCAPYLIVYSDYRSVRRNMYAEPCNPSSPTQLFSALAHPNNNLRRLSWTNYDDLSFHLHMSPMLSSTAANLEFLELTFCSTDLYSVKTAPSHNPGMSLTLPALRSLKVTLDNATFSVLASWVMPVLENLSVVSADFSYAGLGFSEFFKVHGQKLYQLELGHSTSMIEEHYLTIPVDPPLNNGARSIPLAQWCPNLREFICSADAEWNWQNPDWIAPHILLPSHPRLEFIGIRDMDKRLLDDLSLVPVNDESPFFMLLSQMETLLQREAFPNLRFIRDMCLNSDLMRRRAYRSGVSGGCVLNFWSQVLELCRNSGVWLEDYRGTNVTMRDLQRAHAEALLRGRARANERKRSKKFKWAHLLRSN
ncbi:hypothetical protein AX17_001542 [Amanita inopinata Kibby_2008]|nr:hypothetical protein AX17_001542 [Amanita inopinata Kibby_2008]